MNWFKRFLKSLEFKTNLGHGSPVRELPTKALTKEQVGELKNLCKRMDLGSGIRPKTHGTKGLGIKVAVDESIGGALTKKIHERGYDVVVRAGHAETDDSWMKRALAEGAIFVISPDLDIPSMIERENMPMVWIDFLFAGNVNPTLNAEMPKAQKHEIWLQYVHDRIQSKLKFFKTEFGGDSYER